MPLIRPATVEDRARITEIYNHYVEAGPVTFDVRSFTLEERGPWFEPFGAVGPYRLLVVEADGRVEGYAGSMRFRKKPAYDTSVELTAYLAPGNERRGYGRLLYSRLFEILADEPVHMAYAGITLPNPASIAMHERLGFTPIGVFREVGFKHDRYWDVAWYERPI